MNRPLSVAAYIVKKLWLFCAIVLVLFAVLLSALRYTLPYLDEEKQLIEDYLSAQYGIQLTIDSLSAAWQGTGPSIVLNGVEFQQNDLSPVELKLEQVYVEVDFWQSLQQRELSSKRFDLVGLHARVDSQRMEKGSEGDFPIVEALRSLFLDQLQSFSLLHGEVTLVTPAEEEVIELSQLYWVNRDSRHQGRGEIRVQDIANNSAAFVIDLYGGKSDLSGTLYVKGESLDISPWISALLPTRSPVERSRGNFEVWASLQNNHIDAVQVEFDDSDIAWRLAGDNNILQSQILGGSIQALPSADGWSVRVDQLILQADNNTLVTDLVGRLNDEGDLTINTVKPISLAPIMALAPLFTEGNSGQLVKQLNPTAELATLQLQWQQKALSVAAKIFDMHWNQSGKVPGLSAIDGEFFWHHDHGVLELEASESELSINNLLPQNLTLDRIRGRAYFYPESEGDWVLSLQNMQVESELLSFTQDIRYQFGSGVLSAAMEIERMALKDVPGFFPAAYMGKGTVNYLQRAFSDGGQVQHASVLWFGNPAQFPFADGQGVFQARVDVADAGFTFAPDWPALADLNMRLMFENESLTMTSPASQLMDIELSDLYARIPRLSGSSVLTIDAKGQGSGEQVAALMRNSGLKDSLGKILTQDVVVSGPVASEVKLEIPLNGKNVKATGIARLDGNQVNVNNLDLKFDQASGEVGFSNANISINGLTASLFGQPVALELAGNQLSDEYLLDIELSGNWAAQPLIEKVNPAFADYLKGDAQWRTDVSVSLGKDGFQYNASMTSELAGVESRLPAPFYKDSMTVKELMVLVDGDQDASDITLSVGNDINFSGVLPHDTKQFAGAHLALGNSDIVGLGTGFSISAALPEVDVARWYHVIDLLIGGLSSDAGQTAKATQQPGYFSVPQRIFVEAENLIVAGQTLTDVTISARQQSNNWSLNVLSSQAKAEVKLFDAWLEQGIEIDADFIRLAEWQTDESEQEKVEYDYQPDALPPIRFHCDACNLLDRDFGTVDLEVTRTDNGMLINRFDATNDFGELRASGSWLTADNNTSVTHFEGDINSHNIGGMLSELGVNSGIKDSKASIEFVLNWDNSPFNFAMESLNGSVQTELTDGYLTQVSDKGSRIFTLFSLNSLVRKLSLDFRDVFAQGFFYDDIKGSLEIVDGVANTTDTVIDGGAGEIEIKGYTDLANKTLNYNVSFAPNVTGNLPFLVYFMVNPPTALAALALDQVLTSAKVISNVNYHITGTIDNPELEEVGRDSTDIELPAQRQPAPPESIDNEPVEPAESKEPVDADS
ncbi:MAG: TIGR02099 family protein [Alteromonas sp.]|nr:TIGR02099 family protein [Alteromonas sp.]